MSLEQDEFAHSCAFCQQFVIDLSEENGGLSATRRQMLDRFLLRAGLEGPDVSHPEEYEEERSTHRTDLTNFILFDVAPKDLRSPAAKDCIIAKDLDQSLSLIRSYTSNDTLNRMRGNKAIKVMPNNAMLLAKLPVFGSCGAQGAYLDFFLYNPHPACPKRSRPGKPIPDYWTRPSTIKTYPTMAEEGAASSVISARPVTFFPRQHTLDHSRSWLCTCIHGHGEIRHAAGPSYRPKRLLAISQGDPQNNSTFVVIVDNTQRVPYATLSYKWGQGQEPILTKKMLREGPGSLRFHITRLPQTIADAVFVCQSLGIEYLWVDALCIIQDDGQDKAEQIGQMQQIYSQSTITIVASRANSSKDGFLHPRLESGKGLRDTYCRLTYRSKGGDEGSIILRLSSRHEEGLREPLHERGWAYQEFLLPPRVIDYGRLQTKYHCGECGSTITDGGIGARDAEMLLARRRGFYELLKEHRGSTELGRGKVINEIGVNWRSYNNLASWPLEDLWKLFVQESSRRQLTIPADRLNSISAITKIFSKLTDQKDEYLAGHWRSGFPDSLMWRKSGRRQHSSEEYFAPSWSWPSAIGEVSFQSQFGKAGGIDVDFKIIDCRVQVTDPITAPFASVSSGCLHVRAETLGGNVSCGGEHNIRIPLQVDSLPPPFDLDRPNSFPPMFEPDGRIEEMAEGTIMPVLLVVFEMPSNSYPHTSGMVVKEVGDGLYRRVGWFKSLDSIYARAYPVPGPVAPYMYEPNREPNGTELDMKLVKETREAWYNIFEVRELKII